MDLRRLVILALPLLCFHSGHLAAQSKSEPSSRVLALETKWTDAYREGDISILNSLLADEFVITIEDGSTYGKVGYIGHSGNSSLHVDVAELSDLKVRFHGNVAVVTGAYHERGELQGKHYEYHDRLTDVWINNGGKWQVIASHYSVPVSE